MELDKHLFVQLINQHKGTILSLCKVYYPQDEDQKDAFQDVVLQLWKSMHSFGGRAKINTWIFRVSLNTLLNKKRKESKSITTETIEPVHSYLSSAKADGHVELLYQIIQDLRDMDKAMVVLYLEGYGNREIAQILGLSPTNVSTRFSRLKAQLKEKYHSKSHAAKRS